MFWTVFLKILTYEVT